MKRKNVLLSAVLIIAVLLLAGCDGYFEQTPEIDNENTETVEMGQIVWNGDSDIELAFAVDAQLNTTRNEASGIKITSNASSDEFPGIYFIWDSQQNYIGYLKAAADVFNAYESFIITAKVANEYWDFLITPAEEQQLTEDGCYVFLIQTDNNKNINMVFIDEWTVKEPDVTPPEENDNDCDNTGTFWRASFGGALQGLPFDRYRLDSMPVLGLGWSPLKIVIIDTAMLNDFFADTYSVSLNGARPEQSWVPDERFSDIISKYDDKFFESRQLVTFFLGASSLNGESLNVGRNGQQFRLGETTYTEGILNINIDYTHLGGFTVMPDWFAIIETNIVSADTAVIVNVTDNYGRVRTF